MNLHVFMRYVTCLNRHLYLIINLTKTCKAPTCFCQIISNCIATTLFCQKRLYHLSTLLLILFIFVMYVNSSYLLHSKTLKKFRKNIERHILQRAKRVWSIYSKWCPCRLHVFVKLHQKCCTFNHPSIIKIRQYSSNAI